MRARWLVPILACATVAGWFALSLRTPAARDEARALAAAAAGPSDAAASARAAPDLADPGPGASGSGTDPTALQPHDTGPRTTAAEAFGAAASADLLVEVVAPDGTPLAGIPLRLDAGGDEAAAAVDLALQTSDEVGRAVFARVRSLVAGAAVPWTLHAGVTFANEPALRLDAAALAGPIVRFVLPPGGAIEVLVRELDGTSAPRGTTVRLRCVDAQDVEQEVPAAQLEAASGSVCFPWVELGRKWSLAAWRPGGTSLTRHVDWGPARNGERARFALDLGRGIKVVSYRVLDPASRPLARVEVELSVEGFLGGVQTIVLPTTEAGRITLDGEAPPFGSNEFMLSHRPAGGSIHVGRGSLPADLQPGWNDGGDIHLGPEPILCSGRVVDAEGAPVADAEVAAGGEPQMFAAPRRVTGRTGADGRFTLRGLWKSGTFPLRARAGPSSSDERTVEQGARDVELILRRRCTIRGTLVVDPEVDPEAIRFVLVTASGERIDAARNQDALGMILDQEALPPGRFELEPVLAGSYDLLCLLEGEVLARLDGLDVRADLDVGDVDLRGRVSVCEIELLGAADEEPTGGEYSFRIRGETERRGGSFSGPLVRILATRMPIDVELRPRGYRTAELKGVRGRVRHVLAPALRVRIVLVGGGELPSAPFSLGCDLYRNDAKMSEPAGARWFTPERRAIALLVSGPGRLELRWILEHKREGPSFGGAFYSHVLPDHWKTIDVRDQAGEQVFEVHLDGSALSGLTAR